MKIDKSQKCAELFTSLRSSKMFERLPFHNGTAELCGSVSGTCHEYVELQEAGKPELFASQSTRRSRDFCHILPSASTTPSMRPKRSDFSTLFLLQSPLSSLFVTGCLRALHGSCIAGTLLSPHVARAVPLILTIKRKRRAVSPGGTLVEHIETPA